MHACMAREADGRRARLLLASLGEERRDERHARALEQPDEVGVQLAAVLLEPVVSRVRHLARVVLPEKVREGGRRWEKVGEGGRR